MKKFGCLLVFYLLSFTTTVCADALSDFITGNAAYKNGLYEEAVTEYGKILQNGKENGQLHYNLGNAYYKLSEYGRAVAAYERAADFIPRDSDLRFNRKFVLSKVNLSPEDTEGNVAKRAFWEMSRNYTDRELFWIMLGVFLYAAAVHLSMLYFRWNRAFSWGVIGALALIFATAGLGRLVKNDYRRDLAVVILPTDSLFEPLADSSVHFHLKEGERIKILQLKEDWAKVQRPDRKAGWVHSDNIEKL